MGILSWLFRKKEEKGQKKEVHAVEDVTFKKLESDLLVLKERIERRNISVAEATKKLNEILRQTPYLKPEDKKKISGLYYDVKRKVEILRVKRAA